MDYLFTVRYLCGNDGDYSVSAEPANKRNYYIKHATSIIRRLSQHNKLI
jgi:hypothetical protein